jgi:hypothetical protein
VNRFCQLLSQWLDGEVSDQRSIPIENLTGTKKNWISCSTTGSWILQQTGEIIKWRVIFFK